MSFLQGLAIAGIFLGISIAMVFGVLCFNYYKHEKQYLIYLIIAIIGAAMFIAGIATISFQF